MSRSPELSEVLAGVAAGVAADLRVSLVARVERFDAATQEADCLPVAKQSYTDEDGNRAAALVPVVPSVPVVYPKGCYAALAVGDYVLLVFSDISLDKWLQTGGVVDPESDERHHLANAIAIPCITPFSAPRALAAYQGAALGKTLKAYLDDLEKALAALTANGLSWVTPRPTVPTIESATFKVLP